MANSNRHLIVDDVSDMIAETAERIVTAQGANNLTVTKILVEMGITNRVFYNRFHNINEVLDIVYRNMIVKIRQEIREEFADDNDFFSYVIDLVANSLIMSYDNKMKFNQYFFESDSLSQANYIWWTESIKKLIDYAKEHKYIKDVDSEIMSYSIWCFCRGYNADAVGRGLPKEEAAENFRYSFGFLLEGLKK